MTKVKPHILDKDKKKFRSFLGWTAPYTPRTGMIKLRNAFASFGLTNRWIEFRCLKNVKESIFETVKVQGIITGCLWRTQYCTGKDFCIELRDVFWDGKPIVNDRRFNKHFRLCFSAEEIYKVNQVT